VKRPSFQFYPADWQANSNLRRCSHEERGIWLDVLCLLHDQEPYGLIRWPLIEIAQAVGTSVAKLRGIVTKGVLKGADAGERVQAVVFVPRHGRKDGPPVTILPEQEGPVWYSSRMLVDEYKRVIRGESSAPDYSPKPPFGEAPKPTPDPSPSRARASSSSSSSSSTSANTPTGVFAVSSTPTGSRFAMVSNWVPSSDCIALARRRCIGVPDLQHDFVEDAIPEFILYWRGRPSVFMDPGKWDTTFLKHVAKQWEIFRAALNNPNSLPRPLPADFYPSEKTIADLAVAGMDEEGMLGSLDRFKRYHLEKGELSCTWHYRFHQWALDDQLRYLSKNIPIEQKLTDRSWAEDVASCQ
jgi:hypothetical protein